MENKRKSRWLAALRYLPLILCAVFMGIYLFSGKEITAERLLHFAPEDPIYAAFFMLGLYCFKSLTVFFPIIILNVLGGFLFEPAHALIVNMVGVLAELTIPYWLGRASGADYTQRLYEKHPKIGQLITETSGNHFVTAFFLRVISCLPGDAVSMVLGANKLPYWIYLIGSFLGTLPSTVAATLLGMSITDPTSPMFWVSIGLTVGFAVISIFIYFIWRKVKYKKQEA